MVRAALKFLAYPYFIHPNLKIGLLWKLVPICSSEKGGNEETGKTDQRFPLLGAS